MVSGQSYIHGKCLDCGTELPELKDEQSWGLATCTNCGKRHDTKQYEQSGGIFLNNGVCGCERCNQRYLSYSLVDGGGDYR